MDLKEVNIYYGSFQAVADVSLSILPRSVTAFIGPSGCGKTTVLRTLNRMHEVIPGARVEGTVLLDDDDIYAPVSIPWVCAALSAWCSSARIPSLPCRFATT
ncbi:phosphate import ATP-binding protein pstB [Mycobacterium xenopi 3993]|nr:phosphate import ATP-binding protein pstB [Mycobacterium xenopi 3993]